MIRIIVSLAMALALVAASTPAIGQEPPAPPPSLGDIVDGRQASPPELDHPDADTPPSVEELSETLSLVGRVGQLMILTPGGLTGLNSTDRSMFKDFPPGGIVIPQILRPQDAASYVVALRAMEAEVAEKIPLLIGANFFSLAPKDGRNIKLFLNVPTMLTWASGGVSDSTMGLVNIMMQDLHTMGFNMHLGPSLGFSNQLEPTIGDVNGFGNDPKFIAELASQFAIASQENEIIWVPMGFPGGSNNVSESGRAVLLTPKSQLRRQDLLPFERAIEAGAKMIHVGNTLVPTLDGSTPASLSPMVMKTLLRDILGFEGLIIAGPIDELAIRNGRSAAEAAVLALNAGADMLYWESMNTKAIMAIGTIVKAIDNGTLQESTVNGAFERVVEFKRELGLIDREISKPKDSEKLLRERSKAEEPYKIERRGVTLFRNHGGILPLSEDYSMAIGVTGTTGVEELADAMQEYIKPIMRQRITTAQRVGRIQDFEIERIVRAAGGTQTMVCVLSNDVAPAGQLRLIKLLKQTGSKIVVVLLGYPRNPGQFHEADAVIAAYSNPNIIHETVKAVADILMGNAPIEILPAFRDLESSVGVELGFDAHNVIRSPVGRLPITLDERFTTGFSMSYRPNLSLQNVQWDFGDGSKSREAITAHAYSKPGVYKVTLSVESSLGETETGHFGVVVK